MLSQEEYLAKLFGKPVNGGLGQVVDNRSGLEFWPDKTVDKIFRILLFIRYN